MNFHLISYYYLIHFLLDNFTSNYFYWFIMQHVLHVNFRKHHLCKLLNDEKISSLIFTDSHHEFSY